MNIDLTPVIILIGSFLLMIAIRFPIAFAIGISSVITTMYIGLPLQMVAQNMVKGINVSALLTIPFFILAGEIMVSGGISQRLIQLSNALVGWLRGGLAMVNITASMFFGGISGSSAADAASIGTIMIPMMKKQGYEAEFATNVTMASSVQGVLVPPSHNMVIYALAAGSVSIGKLFLAGIIPGILLGASLMIYSYIVSVRKQYPKGDKFNFRYAVKTTQHSILGLLTVLIVVAGVVTGAFTVTESAAVASLYAFVLSYFVYKEMSLQEFWQVLGRTVKTLAIVLILISTSSAFGWLLAYLKVPALVVASIASLTSNPIVVLLILNVILLILGTLMDMAAIILITTPILLPVATSIGVDPVHFGVIMMLNLGIGLLTPPVGTTLFIGSAISGIKIERLSRTLLPFYLVMIGVLLLITYVPAIVMFIPRLLS